MGRRSAGEPERNVTSNVCTNPQLSDYFPSYKSISSENRQDDPLIQFDAASRDDRADKILRAAIANNLAESDPKATCVN
jgi:hypothetical protein